MDAAEKKLLKEAHDAAQRADLRTDAILKELQSHGSDGDGKGAYLPRLRDDAAEQREDVKWIRRVLSKIKDGPTT